MTNGEKFKTAEERTEAFGDYCDSQKIGCDECPLNKYAGNMCRYAWLDLEHKEVLKPCPFCGGKAAMERMDVSDCKYRVRCSNVKCKIVLRTRWLKSAEEAAEDWNRRHNERD